MVFLDKYYLLGIVIAVFIALAYLIFYGKFGKKFKFKEELAKAFPYAKFLKYFISFLLFLILSLYFIILANPNKVNVNKNIEKNGINIVFALDISASMNANDLKPSRIEAAKKILVDFINKLKTDRAGLVIFAGKPIESVPLTFDYNILKETIKRINTDILNQNNPAFNGTAIGDAILLASNMIKKAEEKDHKKETSVIILLTDGDANKGVNPVLAAQYAKKLGIKIYTIGIGSPHGAYINYQVGPFIQKIPIPPLNGKALQQIAQITNGQFFRATDNQSLEQIFKTLEKLEKNKLKVDKKKLYQPLYYSFVIALWFLLTLFFIFKFKEI